MLLPGFYRNEWEPFERFFLKVVNFSKGSLQFLPPQHIKLPFFYICVRCAGFVTNLHLLPTWTPSPISISSVLILSPLPISHRPTPLTILLTVFFISIERLFLCPRFCHNTCSDFLRTVLNFTFSHPFANLLIKKDPLPPSPALLN